MHDLVEQDNVDITLLIGGELTGEDDTARRIRESQQEESDIEEWEIIDAEVVLTDRATSDYVDMRITPARGVDFPPRPSVKYDPEDQPGGYLGRTLTLDVDNEIRVDTAGPEETRVFTGSIANMTPLGDYTYKAIAHDPSQEPFAATDGERNTEFMNSTVNLAQASPTDITDEFGFGYYDQTESLPPGNRKILISELVNLILDEADIPEDNRVISLTDTEGITGQPGQNRAVLNQARDIEITFSEWEVPIEEALDRASKAANADWWFDRFGNFHFGPRLPDRNIFAYTLSYITDASDGKTSPAYRSVRVIGDGIASEEGWQRSNLINEDPITTTGTINELESDNADLAKPVFVYRNMEINSKTEAELVRDDIIDDLKNQRGEGTVTVLGFPELRPNDAIEMPNTEEQPMGGERYAVEKVSHRINSSDGFLTRIGVQGLGNPQEIMYEEDVQRLEEAAVQWRDESRLERRIRLIEEGVQVGL